MSVTATAYNERSWAIDLIGFLKSLSTQNNRAIKDAGGEQTVRTEGGSLFPDVLLFGDRATARILQGWELKMPDTNIDDYDFFDNAQIKARALGLDSFILWNVSYAHLYILNTDNNQFVRSAVWSDLSDITSRKSVVSNRNRWEKVATDIFNYLNDLFENGAIEGRQFIDAYRSGGITALIMENAGEVAQSLIQAATRNARLRAEMTLWWNSYQAEYAKGAMVQVLAQAIISNWIGKILFAHILREKDERAHQVAMIDENTTPSDALEIFKQLSEDCNFWTIFSDSLGLRIIPANTWNQLKQFNHLLADLRVGSVDQAQLSGILEATVEVATRKLRGQYPTPIELARFLVSLCVNDIENDRVYDPCCGSGTIARAALEQKLDSGISPDQVSKTVFASDQDPQAVQIATFALAKPNLMHMPLRIFQHDAFTLNPDLSIPFKNPSDGSQFNEILGQFNTIASNLPFVAQKGRAQYGNALTQVTTRLKVKKFSKRADIAAYLPFVFEPMLYANGRLGIIITNAWLGTEWGDHFYQLLEKFFHLRSVITSGAGRWFKNSKVVTNILIMDKKTLNNQEQPNNEIKFIVLTRPIEEMSDLQMVQIAAAQVELGQTQNDTMIIRSVSASDMIQFRTLGLGGNAQFVNCNWALSIPLIKLSNIFSVRRGERKGLNKMFYPKANHGIEAEYIKPLAKSPKDFVYLSTHAKKEAFSCSRTEDELIALGHTGALNWIRRFATNENIKKLSTRGKQWYQMDADDLTDLVMFINYGERLFVGRIDPPAFTDQRFVILLPKGDVDIELHHALLNSAISIFIIEGMGFGRGQGVLDLSKDHLENHMHILDANQLTKESIQIIKDTFAPLQRRPILPISDELEQTDRQIFDDSIIKAFSLTVDRQEIYDSILSLVSIRMTATD